MIIVKEIEQKVLVYFLAHIFMKSKQELDNRKRNYIYIYIGFQVVCATGKRKELPMNARKIAAFVLALALFALPILCLGEGAPASFLEKAYEAGRGVKATFTFIPGQALDKDPSMATVSDLLKALRVEAFRQKQGDEALHRIELFLKDKPSISLTLFKEADEFHIFSSLLQDQALSFPREEYEHLLAFDPQSLQADLLAPLSAWFSELGSDAKITTGTFESDKHDTAATQTVYSLSADRLSSFLSIITGWASQDVNLDRILAVAATPLAGGAAASEEKIRQAILALPESFLQVAGPAMKEPATITTWLDEGGVMKASELKARFSGTVLAARQYVQTQADGVTTQYSLNIAPEEAQEADNTSTMFGMIAPEADSLSVSVTVKDIAPVTKGDDVITSCQWRFSITIKGSGTVLGGLGLAFTGQTVTSAQSTQKDWSLQINARPYFGATLVCSEKCALSGIDASADGTFDLYYLPGNTPTCTVAYTASSGEPEAMPALPENSVRLDKMNPDELYAWWQNAYPGIMEQLTAVMDDLPR